MHEAQLEGAPGLVVSVASRVDLHYLVASGRLDAALAAQVWAVTTYPDVNVRAAPVTETIAERFSDAELAALRDPWDRLIVASAIDLGMPLVTKDSVMTDLGGPSAWWT